MKRVYLREAAECDLHSTGILKQLARLGIQTTIVDTARNPRSLNRQSRRNLQRLREVVKAIPILESDDLTQLIKYRSEDINCKVTMNTNLNRRAGVQVPSAMTAAGNQSAEVSKSPEEVYQQYLERRKVAKAKYLELRPVVREQLIAHVGKYKFKGFRLEISVESWVEATFR